MSGRLIVLGKQPGVCPVRVRKSWRRIFDKIVIKVTGSEYTMACQDDQLYARIKAVIDGTFHRVQYFWNKKSTTEDWGFLLVDTKNAFNEIN